MISSAELFRAGLAALLVGIAIPLASQLVAAVPAVVAAARAFHDRSEP
jgi:hypothetical protein